MHVEKKQYRKWLWRVIAVLLLVPAFQVGWTRFFNPKIVLPHGIGAPAIKSESELNAARKTDWLPLSQVSPPFLQCVWQSEDRHFFDHWGFDFEEIAKAREEARQSGKPPRGASTITQQCARSLFLWQGRSWLRKGLETYYTLWMELLLSKKRILELYVNVIEFGDGIYGIEAASQHYYGVPAKDLTREQAAMLVAIMPNPKQWDPLHPTERVLKRQRIILERSEWFALPVEITNAQSP